MVQVVSAYPLTPGRFADLEALFAQPGCSFARGCWCMDYRLSGRQTPPEGVSLRDFRKVQLRELARGTPMPGLLGYDAEGRPVGWVAVGPRQAFAKLERSVVMRPVDDRPVWSIVCFVVPSPYREQGVASALLRHAIDHARHNGAQLVEGYPIDAAPGSQAQWLWHGAQSMFERAGFTEVARRKPKRPVMRLSLTRGRRRAEKDPSPPKRARLPKRRTKRK